MDRPYIQRQKDTTHKNKFIKDNDMALYIVRKSEKLTSAIYRVTETLEHKEPLRWVLRKKALSCMIKTLSFSRTELRNDYNLYKTSLLLIKELTTLLEVSFTSSLVSQMNFSILRDEYSSLASNIEEFKLKYIKKIDLNVIIPELYMPLNKEKENEDITNTQRDSYKLASNTNNKLNHRLSKGHIKSTTQKNIYNKKVTPNIALKEDKVARREHILEFIKTHGEVNIKDIFSIPELSKNYSEKTIQRELVDMVSSGILKKKGERRWSKYLI